MSLLFLATSGISAQGIRVNFTEMTSTEKSAFTQALWTLKNSGFIDNMAQFHSDYFASNSVCCANANNTPIHFNFDYFFSGSSGLIGVRDGNDVFLAWHRRFLLEFERALKSIDSSINLPYWDWTTYQSTQTSGTGGLWTSDFLGQFNRNFNWRFNGNRIFRNLGRGGNTAAALPVRVSVTNNSNRDQNVNALLQLTNWNRFSYLFEGDPSRNVNSIHARPHSWVGGVMGQGGSPADPAFYLHHAMVDKIWQEWIEARGYTSGSNLYEKTSMPRYDGSSYNSIFNQTVNPDSMINSDEIGVFYAENGYVLLDNYTVSNTYFATEVFDYNGEIEIGDNFIVPSGRTVIIHSNTHVEISDDFHAEEGSDVTIIDDGSTSNRGGQSSSYSEIYSIVSDEQEVLEKTNEEKLQVYPNPFKEMATIAFHLDDASEVLVELVDLNGRIVKILEPVRRRKAGMHKINVSGQDLSTGIYLVRLKTDTYTETKRLVFSGR